MLWPHGTVFKLIACLTLSLSLNSAHASLNDLWKRWEQHNPESTQTIDHQIWQRILKRYVVTKDGQQRFLYKKVSRSGFVQLTNYIQMLSQQPIDEFNRKEQLAYWINLYNALTIKIILEHYPVNTIQSIKLGSGIFSEGPWDSNITRVNRANLTLNDIANNILINHWQDARIRYALSCAALSCPNLQDTAFTASNVEKLLDKAASDYINKPTTVNIDDGKLIVSKFYFQYKKDFGGSDKSVIEHLKSYAKPELQNSLKPLQAIGQYQFDWKLNET